ncbi:extracellular solute-binding protein [Streptomyces sp. NPDC048172]|uniref:extracellular solute-binding protein n=1 Tax=Streptomyces sp. NPDC048172 TaxID=3365505 RepID=UPI00371377CB
MRRRALASAAAALLALPLSGCGLNAMSAPSESLTIYASRPDDIGGGVLKDFEKAHPEYAGKVRVLTIGAQEVLERIRAESRSPQADVWWGGTSQQFDQGVDAGLLTRPPKDVVERVPAKYRGERDLWLGEMRMAQLFVYNDEMMRARDVPRDWDDLLEPAYKNKILIRDVAASGTMRSVWTAMIDREARKKGGSVGAGYDWLKRLDANTKEYTASPTDLYLRLQREEAPLSVWNLQDVLVQRAKGIAMKPKVPASGAPMLLDGVGKVKGGPNGKAADAFLRFLLRQDTQRRLAQETYQLPTVPLEKEPKWLASLHLKEMPVDWRRISRHETKWITHWSEHIKGRG